MQNYETIDGPKIGELIRGLIENKTLVHVSVPRTEYERLTLVLDARTEDTGLVFQIDPPEGLLPTLAQNPVKDLYFQFSTPDRLPHRFTAVISRIDGNEIWLRHPEFIQRYQLRRNFRIKAPSNAQATIQIDDRQIKVTVDNISLGGFFCHCPNSVKGLISMDQLIHDVDMFFMIGGESQQATIKRTRVRRLEGRTHPKHFGLALEFVDMDGEMKKHLTQIIYKLQREFLKNRLKG